MSLLSSLQTLDLLTRPTHSPHPREKLHQGKESFGFLYFTWLLRYSFSCSHQSVQFFALACISLRSKAIFIQAINLLLHVNKHTLSYNRYICKHFLQSPIYSIFTSFVFLVSTVQSIGSQYPIQRQTARELAKSNLNYLYLAKSLSLFRIEELDLFLIAKAWAALINNQNHINYRWL